MSKFTISIISMLLLFSPIKTDDDNNKTDCNIHNKECKQCITDIKCHFVTWKSTDKNLKNLNSTKCVDRTLSEDDVRKQGPVEYENDNTDWEMTFSNNKTECKGNSTKGYNL